MNRILPTANALLTNPLVWTFLAITVTYFCLSTLVPVYYLIEGLNAAFLGVAVAVTIVYWPLLKQLLLRDGEYDRVSQMALGIIVQWASVVITRLYSTNLRITQGSEGLTSNHSVVGYCILLLIIAGYLQATAPSFDVRGETYVRDNQRVFIGLSVGIFVGIVSLVLQRTGLDWLPWV